MTDLRACELVVRRANHHELIVATDFGMQSRRMRWRFDKSDIDGVISDPVLDRFRVGDGHVSLHLRMARFEFTQYARQDELRNGHAAAEQQRTADRTGEFTDALIELCREPENALRVIEHDDARGRKCNLAMTALEQARVEMLFQLLDLKRDRRLRHEKLLGSFSEAQLLRYRIEDLQSSISHASREPAQQANRKRVDQPGLPKRVVDIQPNLLRRSYRNGTPTLPPVETNYGIKLHLYKRDFIPFMPFGFYIIMAAQFFSSLADNALLIAAIATLALLDSPAWLTPMLKLFFTISYVVLAPFVGAFADALPKGQVMFVVEHHQGRRLPDDAVRRASAVAYARRRPRRGRIFARQVRNPDRDTAARASSSWRTAGSKA